MTSINYDSIYSMCLGEIDDPELIAQDEDTIYEFLNEWLHKSLSKPYVRRLFSSITLDDEAETMTYEMANATDESSDNDFLLDLLGKAMMIEWLSPQVRSKVNIAQMFSNSDQKFYSQSSHLSELRGMLEDAELSVRKMIRDRGYIYNTYLDEE